jgi:hypothetical protein
MGVGSGCLLRCEQTTLGNLAEQALSAVSHWGLFGDTPAAPRQEMFEGTLRN